MRVLIFALALSLLIGVVPTAWASHDTFDCSRSFSKDAKFLSQVGWMRWLYYMGYRDEGGEPEWPAWLDRGFAQREVQDICAP